MEKSRIVQQLLLPQDMLDHICSFVFYTLAESIKRKRQMHSKLVGECKRVRKETLLSWGPNIVSTYTVYFVLPRGNQLILAHICSTCGNYTKSHHHSSIVCQCVV